MAASCTALLKQCSCLNIASVLGVDSPFFSAIVLFKNQPFPQGFWWFSRKKDPWKEWGSYPLDVQQVAFQQASGAGSLSLHGLRPPAEVKCLLVTRKIREAQKTDRAKRFRRTWRGVRTACSLAENLPPRKKVQNHTNTPPPHRYGCGSKLNRRGYAGFGPCFHLPGQPVLEIRFFEPQPYVSPRSQVLSKSQRLGPRCWSRVD